MSNDKQKKIDESQRDRNAEQRDRFRESANDRVERKSDVTRDTIPPPPPPDKSK